MANVLSGQDSVSPSGMLSGKDVYAGYGGASNFSNMSGVKARFPGKKYVIVDTHVSQVDCYDIESGGGSASEAPAFFRQWKQINTNKPVFYASASTIGSVVSALTNAGISRDKYYLWVAEWDGSSAIPAGYDAKQYASTSGYDSDVFYDYMFGPPAPVWPLEVGSTDTADVKTLQEDLNKWASVIGLKTPLDPDGDFGPLTEAAVVLAQKYFGDKGPAGTASQTFVSNNLAKTPGQSTTPPPPPPWVFGKVVNLKVPAAGPSSFKVEFESPAGKSPQPIARYEVGVCKGSKLGAVVPSYPRYIQSIASGSYGEQYGSLAADTEYVVAVRAQLADGSHSSEWSTVVFKTAK